MNAAIEKFGSKVFGNAVMKERLPQETYTRLQQCINENKRISPEDAEIIAAAMRDWAVENGVTHFTHWFQPMTNITAEKHEGLITPDGNGGAIMEFRGKELIHGESDASSFPSGGLRATFEARGYTAWDITSYAFIKENVLCIPTAFCSYGGEALDMKTPLLRSMEAINKQGLRIMKLFGNDKVGSIKVMAGPEQEYFLIDKEMYEKRMDLIYTGRTLFGCPPPKAQELNDHYYGIIKPRVHKFMQELDAELWKLGIYAKTEHNEAAPAQHELAPYYISVNIAADHNQIVMELMQKLARRHGMVCLLHEKPFEGVNGSGKHNNWSICTDTGINLLEPGTVPHDNAQFLLFLCAVLQAVDNYQDLLRLSVASAGNDHRLGASEAPPAVVSVFLGEELCSILSAIENNEEYKSGEKEIFKVGVHALPKFPKDSTDRNRTSPFAFTGNKFEFRMLGSSASISGCNTILNTAVAESLRIFADTLEKADDFDSALHNLIKDTYSAHKRVIFNGNGYDDEWLREAESRGLLNLQTTPDAVPCYLAKKNVELFERHRVYSTAELKSRYEIKLDSYNKVIRIEALTMLEMAKKQILPAVSEYSARLAAAATIKKQLAGSPDCSFEESTACRVSALTGTAFSTAEKLEKMLCTTGKPSSFSGSLELAEYNKNSVIPAMNALRAAVDELESCTAKECWPYPSYGDLLFSVK